VRSLSKSIREAIGRQIGAFIDRSPAWKIWLIIVGLYVLVAWIAWRQVET
jgi:hypothetical protein